MSNAEELYKDIIHMERPRNADVMRKHPPMDLSARAKIFSPFAAVRGHDDRLRMEDEKLALAERREFSEEDAARLSEKMSSLKKRMEVTVTYFLPCNDDPGRGIYTKATGQFVETNTALGILRISMAPTDRLAKGQTLDIALHDIAAIKILAP